MLARDRFSAGSRIRMESATKMQQMHIQARARAATLHAANPVLPLKLMCVHSLLRHCKQADRLRKCEERASAISHTQHRATQQHTHTRQPHRTLPARNSAFPLASPVATLIGGFVVAWARPGAQEMVSAIVDQTSRRKMPTFIDAIWGSRFCPTL